MMSDDGLNFYPTPSYATEALLDVETFTGSVWEPACGTGSISKVLLARGHEVRSTDLVDRGYGEAPVDFLTSVWHDSDNIITNPPFRFAQEFMEHAVNLTDKVAMLCRLAFLETPRRAEMFQDIPLKKVWIFAKRLTFVRGGADMDDAIGKIAFAWFVIDHSYVGDPTIGWI